MTRSEPTQLTRIGYWVRGQSMAAGPVDESWPDPKDFVDEGWDAEERAGPAGYLNREDVASFLERGFVARAYMGLSMPVVPSDERGAGTHRRARHLA